MYQRSQIRFFRLINRGRYGDNVAVTSFVIEPKTKIEKQSIVSVDLIPFGHKICLKPINKSEPVIKYDQIIGFASKNIKPGEHVHSHNLEFKEFSREYSLTEKKKYNNWEK